MGKAPRGPVPTLQRGGAALVEARLQVYWMWDGAAPGPCSLGLLQMATSVRPCIHPFSNDLLSTYYVLGPVLCSGDRRWGATTRVHTLLEFTVWLGRQLHSCKSLQF